MSLNKPIRSVMSLNFVWLPNTAKIKDAIEVFKNEKVSFIPILSKDKEKVIGVVEIFNVLNFINKLNENITSAIETVFPIVYEDEPINKVLEKMRETKKLYAIVLEKYTNKVIGVVSVIDILTEIKELKDFILPFINLERKFKVD